MKLLLSVLAVTFFSVGCGHGAKDYGSKKDHKHAEMSEEMKAQKATYHEAMASCLEGEEKSYEECQSDNKELMAAYKKHKEDCGCDEKKDQESEESKE